MLEFIAQNVITLIFSVVTPVAMMYFHKWFTALANRWKLENAAEYEAKLSSLIETAIKGIEQKAISVTTDALKTQKSQEKLQSAIEWVNNELANHKLPTVAPAQLAMKIEAKLWDEVDK